MINLVRPAPRERWAPASNSEIPGAFFPSRPRFSPSGRRFWFPGPFFGFPAARFAWIARFLASRAAVLLSGPKIWRPGPLSFFPDAHLAIRRRHPASGDAIFAIWGAILLPETSSCDPETSSSRSGAPSCFQRAHPTPESVRQGRPTLPHPRSAVYFVLRIPATLDFEILWNHRDA